MLQELSIEIQGLDKGQVYAESLYGHEALSELYEFTVDVITPRPVDIGGLLGKSARIALRVVDEETVVNGKVMAAAAMDPTPNHEFCYRFTVAPALAVLKLGGQNQVHGTDTQTTVVEIIRKELTDANKSGSRTAGSRVARTIRSRILTESVNYPKLDFVMQYRESDFAFISRICEKFGIFYYFDTSGSTETVFFCDRREHFQRLAGRNLAGALPFRSNTQIRDRGNLAIHSFQSRFSAQAGTVELREYNDLTPNVDLGVSQGTAFEGFGVRVDYGENYRTPPEGRLIARKRSELLETARP